MKSYKISIPIVIIAFMLLTPAVLVAQDPPDFNDDTQDVPIDGGVSLLVAAGVAYGLKKYRDNKQVNKTQS